MTGPGLVASFLELPADHPRPAEVTQAPAAEPFELAAGPLAQLAGELGTSMFIVLLAGLEIVLHRYSGHEHFVVGIVPGHCAGQSEGEPIGLLRADVSPDLTVRDVISGAGDAAAASEPADLAPVQVMLQFGTSPAGSLEATGPFDLALSCQPSGDRVRGVAAYSPELFDPPTIRRLIGHLTTVLTAMASDCGRHVCEIPLLTEQEKHQLLVAWNDTAATYPADLCVFQLVERQAERAPASVALTCETGQVSYRDLNARANQVAHHLRALGVGAGTLVAILAERGPEMIIGLLAILKAGGAYVPLDPEYPAARLSFMLEDSAAPVVLTLDRLAAGCQPAARQ